MFSSRSFFIGASLIGLVVISNLDFAQSQNTTTSTAKPSARHPNYVRVLRTQGQDDENSIVQNKTSTASKSPTTTAKPTTTTKSSNRFSSDDKIKSIVLNSGIETTARPRGGLGGLLSSLFANGRSRLSLSGFGGSSSGSSFSTSSSNKTSSRSDRLSNSSKNSTSSVPATGLSPGGILAGVVKAVQNITITFEQMVSNFVKLFSFNNRNGEGSRANRLFGNSAS